MGAFLIFIIIIFGVVAAVSLLSAKKASRRGRTAGAEEQRQRHGGQSVLEWNGPKAEGAPDPEFGELLVEIPKKSGGSARFYLRGVIVEDKRLPYDSLRDVTFAERTPGALLQTPKTAAVMWLVPLNGMGKPVSLFSMHYQYEDATMQAIRAGLGFGQN